MLHRTEFRMKEIRRRTRRYRRQHETRVRTALTAFILVLLAGMDILLQKAQIRGVSVVADAYGSVLLREGASVYIVVGVAAFAAGVALTVLCIRYRKKRSGRTKDAEEMEDIL